jgi:hypothetical protein
VPLRERLKRFLSTSCVDQLAVGQHESERLAEALAIARDQHSAASVCG